MNYINIVILYHGQIFHYLLKFNSPGGGELIQVSQYYKIK